MARLQRKGTLTLWLGRRKSIHHPWTRCRSTFLPSFFTPPSLLFLSWLIISHPPTTFIFFFFFLNEQCFYLFLAVPGLRCHTSFSLAVVRGGYSRVVARVSRCSGFSCCRAQALEQLAQYLWGSGLAASRHVGSSWTKDWTCVSWISRWILYHWATRKAPNICVSVWPI